MGAIYVAAEANEAAVRRHNEGTAKNQTSTISQVSTRNLVRNDNESNGPASLDVVQPKSGATGTPNLGRVESDPRQDDVVAEQQASEIPPQKPARQAPKDPHTRLIVISIPDRQLALLQDGEVIKVYPVAVGAGETPSPEGEFTVINHAVDPTYRHGGKEIAPGKDNPLGTRWMGLSLKGYGIHGTNVQSSIGKAASHGCFRMKKNDVEELYSLVKVGDAVSIHGEQDDLTARLFNTDTNNSIAVVASKSETQIAAGSN
jgi:lipoprotein-anchoring transpeptidase ErfK/SrfK